MVDEPSFPGFGLKSKDVEDGKLVVFPRGVKPDGEGVRQQYLRSHGKLNLLSKIIE